MRALVLIALLGCHGRSNPPPTATPSPSPPQPATARDAGAPDAGRPLGPNAIRGHLHEKRAPYAHGALELCPFGEIHIELDSPCAAAALHLTTRTDATGDFAFTGLPDGDYTVFMLEQPHATLTLPARAVHGGEERTFEIDVDRPDSPPAAASDTTGTRTLRGRFVHDGAPLAFAALELCGAHGWHHPSGDRTPCWNGPHRQTTRADADGAFVFEHVAAGELQIVMLEEPFYPRMVFALGDAVDLGTKRVSTWSEHPNVSTDDESPDQWPDIRR